MARPAAKLGPTRLQLGVRGVLVAGYIGIVALGLTTDVQPRVFWTMLLPLLPISIVLMGFANWRQICPLAFFGEIGRKLNRGTQRRVPKWLERWFFVVTFAVLLTMLVFRLVATNGDGVWLSWLLVAIALVALVTNLFFTGKTWCNFFCPIGLVERVYTEPRSLPTTPNSQCDRCTACKSSCPDIDPENGYWRDLPTTGRRIATYSFPGLVLAFYAYYWLRNGDWEAYFDGRWTRLPADADLAFGSGLFFAPALPALAAATLTLLVFSAASYLLFVLIELVVSRLVEDAERRRHLILALAAFAAFSIFYVFAGAPTLRRIPGASQIVAFAAPLLATLFLVKRWGRTREAFIREKGAIKLLRSWPFEEPPPDDPSEVYGWVKGGERAREHNVSAYANIVREMITDGLVHRGELRLLEGVRSQLGISEREHDKVLARLSEEERDLFERDDAGIEERAQLEGYEAALAGALLRRASEPEISELRRAFGVGGDAHDRLLERMRSESGVLLVRARDHLGRVRALRADLEILAAPESTEAAVFLSYLLIREQDEAIGRVLDLLEIIGPSEEVKRLRSRLLAPDAATRGAAVRALSESCPGAEGLIREMEPLIVDRTTAGSVRDRGAWAQLLERCAFSADLYVRAAAIWASGGSDEPWAKSIVAGATRDIDSLVRETAASVRARSAGTAGAPARFGDLSTIERMQFLRSVPLFGCLDPEDLHDLVGFVEEEIVTSPDALCEEGAVDAGDLFIILEGRASVVVRASSDSGDPVGEREVTVFDPGEIVGEISMLDGSPRSATVRPKDGPVRVLRISGQRFRGRLLPRARVARPLLVTLAQRIRYMSERAAKE